MTGAKTPIDMQALILERLRAKNDGGDGSSKELQKFAQRLTEAFGECVKDRMYHKIQTELLNAKSIKYDAFIKAPVDQGVYAAIANEDGVIHSIFKFDGKFIAFLSRVLFGADIEVKTEAPGREATSTERGLVRHFTGLIGKVLAAETQLSMDSITLLEPEEMEDDEIPKDTAVQCDFEITIGEMRCVLTLLTPLPNADAIEDSESEFGGHVNNQIHDELMRSKVSASVCLNADPRTLQEIQRLKPGDQIPLAELGGLIGKMIVKDQEVFSGQVGRSGGAFSFLVTDAIDQTPGAGG